MALVFRWGVKRISKMIVKILLNKFDCFIIIEGNRGLGKSTLAYKICRMVSTLMKHEEGVAKKDYKFIPEKCLLYKREEVINFFTKRKKCGVADEMINVSFNRDFYNESQKDLIKLMNMNRDYCNLFIACVPHFQTLDTQIKNLCKIRITVERRGFAIIQTQNRTIYSKDRWDTAINEKIERKWLDKKSNKPLYKKLTTFRGVITFTKLSDVAEKKYTKIKDLKRHEIAKEQGYEQLEENEKEEPFEILYKLLKAGSMRNSTAVEGFCFSNGWDYPSTVQKLSRRLKKEKLPHSVSHHYWDKKRTNSGDTNIKVSHLVAG